MRRRTDSDRGSDRRASRRHVMRDADDRLLAYSTATARGALLIEACSRRKSAGKASSEGTSNDHRFDEGATLDGRRGNNHHNDDEESGADAPSWNDKELVVVVEMFRKCPGEYAIFVVSTHRFLCADGKRSDGEIYLTLRWEMPVYATDPLLLTTAASSSHNG